MAAEIEQARAAVEAGAWSEAYRLLGDVEDGRLSGADLDALADAAWWICRLPESLAARQRAYTAFVAEDDERRAGATAWMIAYEHQMLGRTAVAAGWLRRAQRHLDGHPDCVEQSLLAWTEADAARDRGDLDAALDAARRMTGIGRRCGSPDLVAAGVYTEGSVLLAAGRTHEGLALIDESLCAVLAGDLSPMFTGWVYCLGMQTCMAAAEIRRMAEWTEAAMAWCASLPAGNPFLGLCRIHQVEVMALRGAWTDAQIEARLAEDELLAAYPEVAGEAHYIAGEIKRRRGDAAAAEESFTRAHEAGRDPQPGLALLRLSQGKADAADAALRLALAADTGASPLQRSRLLAAQTEVALAMGDLDAAGAAAAELGALAARHGAEVLHAAAAMGEGALALAERRPGPALIALRRARAQFAGLGLPYESAQARMLIAAASRDAGDEEGARLELRAARAEFERLGSAPEARRAAVLLRDGARAPGALTAREVEVLRLVAAGRSNRDIAAALVISEHTVSRHLNNIFAKLGVTSRAAATAFAFTHDLV